MEHALLIETASKFLQINRHHVFPEDGLATARVDFNIDPMLLAPDLKRAAIQKEASKAAYEMVSAMFKEGLVRLIETDVAPGAHAVIITVLKPGVRR